MRRAYVFTPEDLDYITFKDSPCVGCEDLAHACYGGCPKEIKYHKEKRELYEVLHNSPTLCELREKYLQWFEFTRKIQEIIKKRDDFESKNKIYIDIINELSNGYSVVVDSEFENMISTRIAHEKEETNENR